MTSTLKVYCQREDEIARERAGHLPLHAEIKEMNLLSSGKILARGAG